MGLSPSMITAKNKIIELRKQGLVWYILFDQKATENVTGPLSVFVGLLAY